MHLLLLSHLHLLQVLLLLLELQLLLLLLLLYQQLLLKLLSGCCLRLVASPIKKTLNLVVEVQLLILVIDHLLGSGCLNLTSYKLLLDSLGC